MASNVDNHVVDRVTSGSPTATMTTLKIAQQSPQISSSGPAMPPLSRSAPSRSSQLAMFGMTNASTITRPTTPNPTHVKSKSMSRDPSSLEGRRAMAIAALPSFSHNLSDFDKMPVVPGELLTGCLRTDTNAICQAKLANVLAVNNKVLAPYSSSSEDEFSHSSDSGSWITTRRRAGLAGPSTSLNSRGLVIDAHAVIPSRAATDTPPALMRSTPHTDSDSSPGLIPTPGFPSGTNGVIYGVSARSSPYFNAASRDPESSCDDLPLLGGGPGATLSRDATIRRRADRNNNSGHGSRSTSTVRSQSKSGPRSRSDTPRAPRSPERDRTGGSLSSSMTQREREAALFKIALERTGRRNSRPHARATFELSTDEESDDE